MPRYDLCTFEWKYIEAIQWIMEWTGAGLGCVAGRVTETRQNYNGPPTTNAQNVQI